jgi:5'-nucleotidase
MARPFILITNDDGINAPGIRHLWEAIHGEAEVAIIAPHTEKSGCGLGITWTKPLHVRPIQWEHNTPAWSINGTPADCVKMGVSIILQKRPDLIVSGVNRGSNSGRTVLYSGTVGGIIEASFKNIPGIAFSFSDPTVPDLKITKPYICRLIQHVLKNPLPQGTFLNVNFPFNAQEKVLGFRMAKQGLSYWLEEPEKRIHPEGLPYYWLGGKWHAFQEDPESDIALLEQGYITGVPIHVNQLTDLSALQQHKTLTADLFADLDPTSLEPPAERPR